jgi:hypothetical protein
MCASSFETCTYFGWQNRILAYLVHFQLVLAQFDSLIDSKLYYYKKKLIFNELNARGSTLYDLCLFKQVQINARSCIKKQEDKCQTEGTNVMKTIHTKVL